MVTDPFLVTRRPRAAPPTNQSSGAAPDLVVLSLSLAVEHACKQMVAAGRDERRGSVVLKAAASAHSLPTS